MGSPPRSDRWTLGDLVAGAAVVLVALVAMLLQLGTDRWAVGTLLAYGPRWVWLAPPLAALPFAVVGSTRTRILTALAVAIVFGPILELSIPIAPSPVVHAESSAVAILTCNIESGHFDVETLRRVMRDEAADVVMLQECTVGAAKRVFAGGGWHVVARGGLCTATRDPIVGDVSLRERQPPFGWGAYVMDVPVEIDGRLLHAFNVHLETPRKGIEPILERGFGGVADLDRNTRIRAAESAVASDWAASTRDIVVAGDFNMPVDSALYRDYWSRFQNAFSIAGAGFGFTKRSRTLALRIDHVLADDTWQVVSAAVGPDVGSDHRPVIARIERRLLPGDERDR